MKFLLSTIGSRGDVQPLVGLATALRALGHDVRLCVPPDFRDWIEALGFPVVPIGPVLRATAKPTAMRSPLTPEQRRQAIEGTVATQFETITAAADGCDMIIGATALQIAAPSIAERLGIPYVFAAYCPAVLPSPRHPPPVLAMLGDRPAQAAPDYAQLWIEDARRWNAGWRDALNARRAAVGLDPVDDVRSHVLTDRPWLAADKTLGPWPEPNENRVFQSGAWILPDDRPLPDDVEAFLAAGEPPIYFGFGSIRAPGNISQVMIESARAMGRRAIVSRGWADLGLLDDASDTVSIGDVNHHALFPRVAAVVHHGGAGTTTAAALAGVPQVVIAQHYDQHYWSERVERLDIGVAHVPSMPSTETLTGALERALREAIIAQARLVSRAVRPDGAEIAARELVRSR